MMNTVKHRFMSVILGVAVIGSALTVTAARAYTLPNAFYRPDLTITSVSPMDSSGWCQAKSLYYEVKNQGFKDAGGFYVTKTCVAGSRIPLQYLYVQSLPSGRSIFLQFANNCLGFDTITVDSTNLVSEANEANNVTSSTALGCLMLY